MNIDPLININSPEEIKQSFQAWIYDEENANLTIKDNKAMKHTPLDKVTDLILLINKMDEFLLMYCTDDLLHKTVYILKQKIWQSIASIANEQSEICVSEYIIKEVENGSSNITNDHRDISNHSRKRS